MKVVSNHTFLLHTCVCAGWRRVRIRLSGFRRQGISSTPGGFLKCPIPVRVCAEHLLCIASLVFAKRGSSVLHKIIHFSVTSFFPVNTSFVCNRVLSRDKWCAEYGPGPLESPEVGERAKPTLTWPPAEVDTNKLIN